jgi:integrase
VIETVHIFRLRDVLNVAQEITNSRRLLYQTLPNRFVPRVFLLPNQETNDMEFSKETIATLTLPEGKTDYLVFDDELPGFGVRIRAGGKRVWVCQYRTSGRQRRESLGDVRRVDLKTARKAAQKRFAEVLLGGDPQAAKEEARERATRRIGPLVERFLVQQKTSRRANTYVANQRYLSNYWRPLHSTAVDSVTRRIVAARLSEILTEHGVTAAARARGSLSGFFAWLIQEGLAEQNPVIGTANPAEQLTARDRVLTDDELRVIWRACPCDENGVNLDFGNIIKLLMLTGARRDEIGGLRRSEVDLESGILEILGTRTKNHHSLRLPLTTAGISILKSVQQREGRDLLFGGGPKAFSAWSYCKLMLGARAAAAEGRPLAEWRIHDIRRTVATGMAELGIAPHIVETILNHRSGHRAGVGGVYNRALYEVEVKRALALWTDHLLSIVEGAEQKVVAIRVRG